MPAAKKETKKKAVTNEVVTREYTINVHKRIHGMYVCHCAVDSCVIIRVTADLGTDPPTLVYSRCNQCQSNCVDGHWSNDTGY